MKQQSVVKKFQRERSMIEVMKAYVDGKKIQVRKVGDVSSHWSEVCWPAWDWQNFDYRVMPEPPVDAWLLFSPDEGIVNSSVFTSEQDAKDFSTDGEVVMHFREVRED